MHKVFRQSHLGQLGPFLRSLQSTECRTVTCTVGMICMMPPCLYPSTCSKTCTELFAVLYPAAYRAFALYVAIAVEQLSPVRIPHWLRAAFRRDLPLAAGARI